MDQIPGLGRFPGEGKGYPLQYSGLENSMGCIVQGVTKSWTGLSDFHFYGGGRGAGKRMSGLACLNSALQSTFLRHLEGLSFVSLLSLKGISPLKRLLPYSLIWNNDMKRLEEKNQFIDQRYIIRYSRKIISIKCINIQL